MHYRSARLFAVVILVVSVLFAGEFKASALTIVPDDAYSYNGHYYQVYCDLETYDDDAEENARELCKRRGGHLAVINDDEENENVAEYLKSCGIEIPVYIEIDAGYAEKNSFDVSVSDDGRAFNTYDRDRMNELTETFIYDNRVRPRIRKVEDTRCYRGIQRQSVQDLSDRSFAQ